MKKKRKPPKTTEELFGREYVESGERAKRMLSERIAYHERKLAEERASRPKADPT